MTTDRPVRHRILAGLAATGLGLLLAAPPAHGAPKDWEGSEIVTPVDVRTASVSVEALIHRKYNGSLHPRLYFVAPDQGSRCDTPGEQQLTITSFEPEPGVANTARVKATSPTVKCNGTYRVRLEATLDPPLFPDEEMPPRTKDLKFAVPPPPVEGVEAAYGAEPRAVVIAWSAAKAPAPDFKGYQVQRRTGDDWTTLIETDGAVLSFADTTLPPDGGELAYRVRARRNGPDRDVYSSGGVATLNVPSTATGTDEGADGGADAGTDGGADGGVDGGGTAGADDGTTGGAGGGGTTGTGGGTGGAAPRGGRTFGVLPRGQIGIGTKAPRVGLGAEAQSNYPDILLDEGYDEELDYGDGLGGEGDGLSSFFYEPADGRGLAVPVATGFVLAAWAFHFLFLAKAAKPAKVTRPPRHTPGRR